MNQPQIDGGGIRDEGRSLIAYSPGSNGVVLRSLFEEAPLLSGHFMGAVDV